MADPSPRLQELSHDLSPDERRKLLENIQKHLNPDTREEGVLKGTSPTQEEVGKRLKKEIQELGFFQKLWLRILVFFTGRKEESLQLETKLRKMERSVLEAVPGLLSSGGKDLSTLFAQGLYDLFSQAFYLEGLWDRVLKTEGFLPTLVGEILETHLSSPKTQVFDLITQEEMADIYRKTGQKSAIIKRIKDSLPVYLETIHPAVFKDTAEDLLPLYYLRPLVKFPYRLFLQVFGHDPGTLPPEKYPPFRDGSILRSKEFLDRFYLAVHLACKVRSLPGGFVKILERATRLEQGGQKVQDFSSIQSCLDTLLKDVQRIFTEFPLPQIIQLSRGDPFFSIKVSLPSVDVKDIYQTLLYVRFTQQTEDFFPSLRNHILQSEKDSLFQNQNSQLLEFYVLDINPLINSYGLPHFSHVESLNLVNTFLSTYFTVHYQPLIRTLAQVVLQNFKALLSSLLQTSADLEGLKAQILAFDRTLGATSEDGKNLSLLKAELEKKPTSHQLFTSLVDRKNRESQKLVDEALKLFKKLEDQLGSINTHTSPQMKSLLRMPYIMGGARSKISEAVGEKIQMLGKIQRLIQEINGNENT